MNLVLSKSKGYEPIVAVHPDRAPQKKCVVERHCSDDFGNT